jgi:hypothetical protein
MERIPYSSPLAENGGFYEVLNKALCQDPEV